MSKRSWSGSMPLVAIGRAEQPRRSVRRPLEIRVRPSSTSSLAVRNNTFTGES